MISNTKNTEKFSREFQVFKADVTSRPIWILSLAGVPFNRKSKMAFYKSIGYTITKTA